MIKLISLLHTCRFWRMMEGVDISMLSQGLVNTSCQGVYPEETASNE